MVLKTPQEIRDDTLFDCEEREKGYQHGLEEGREEKREKVHKEGECYMLHTSIVVLLQFRLNVSDKDVTKVEAILMMIPERSRLQPIFQSATCAESFDHFWGSLIGQI